MRILSIFGKWKNEPEKLICFSIFAMNMKVGDKIEFGGKEYLITRIAKLNSMLYQSSKIPFKAIYGKVYRGEDL